MNAVKPGNSPDGRVQGNRERKARRFVAHFYAKMREVGIANPEANKEALEKALGIVRSASSEQWVKLAEEMTKEYRKAGIKKKEDAPSNETFELIVAIFETAIKNVDYHLRQAKDDAEIFNTLLQERGTGTTRAEDMPETDR